jgi:hypothetical protein
MFITPKFIARSSVENVYYDKSKVTDELANRYFELTLRKGNRRAFIERLVRKQQLRVLQKNTQYKTTNTCPLGRPRFTYSCRKCRAFSSRSTQ